MRSWSLLLHACTVVALMLTSSVLLKDVYGALPTCSGTIPGDLYYCGQAQACPEDVNEDDCDASGCIVSNQIPDLCNLGGNVLSDLCVNQYDVCSQNYYCDPDPFGQGLCDCTSIPVLDDNGNPLATLAESGFATPCDSPGG